MNTTISWSLISLIITGLAVITYKHPPLARRIIKVCLAFLFILSLYTFTLNKSVENAYYKAIDSASITLNQPETKKLSIDSLKNIYKNSDTILSLIKTNELELNEKLIIYKYQLDLIERIKKSLGTLKNKTADISIGAIQYELFAACVMLAFYLLSYAFNKIGKPDSNKQDDSSNKAAQ